MPDEPVPGLYVHIPFREEPPRHEEAFTVSPPLSDASHLVEALCREAHQYSDCFVTGHAASTLYVGGGRPSLLSSESISDLLRRLQHTIAPARFNELTVEVHPADTSSEYLLQLQEAGATRISIEAVNLAEDEQTDLAPPRSAERAIRTIRDAQNVGFESVSIDLMFDGPPRRASTWRTSLESTVQLGLPHVTLHEISPPKRGSNMHQEERADRLASAMQFLKNEGYEQYELTHFARPGHRSRHQLNYYEHGNYVGLGPGAESFWWPDRTGPGSARRWSNVANLDEYVERAGRGDRPIDHEHNPDRVVLAREYILLRLRTSKGLHLSTLEDRYDVSVREISSSVIDRLVKEGLLHDDPERIRLTDRGRLLTDAITRHLLP